MIRHLYLSLPGFWDQGVGQWGVEWQDGKRSVSRAQHGPDLFSQMQGLAGRISTIICQVTYERRFRGVNETDDDVPVLTS